MKLARLRSSNLAGYHYDAEAQRLTVGFQSGARYAYDKVPPDMAESLAKAESHGSYFQQNIRPLGGTLVKKPRKR